MPSTFDRKLVLDILTQISEAIQKIKKRFARSIQLNNSQILMRAWKNWTLYACS